MSYSNSSKRIYANSAVELLFSGVKFTSEQIEFVVGI